MNALVGLLALGATEKPVWPWGPVDCRDPKPMEVGVGLAAMAATAQSILAWDVSLGPPPPAREIEQLLGQPSDVWHAGLLLGQRGRPALLDRVAPRWMLNLDPDSSVEATSWRVSLRALLVRSEVVRQLGGPSGSFDTLGGAGLDLGLRWIRQGSLLRHRPQLLAHLGTASLRNEDPPTPADEVRLVARSWGRRWAAWAAMRGVRTGTLQTTYRQALRVAKATQEPPSPHYLPQHARADDRHRVDTRVSVCIPTIDRYPYLEPLLHQLAHQTVSPHEVLIIDQTPAVRRRDAIGSIEPALATKVIVLESPGQCRSRNAGLREATGDVILFLDDDDEIPDDLIESHLTRLHDGIDASCGAVNDATAGPPPAGFRHRRVSDVFPTNNTMVRRGALTRSGLFDPVFDRGARADHDLGTRLYLAGSLNVYDPAVIVFHHHAMAGGLRTHGARRITRFGSRAQILQRHLPGTTETYLGLRYFSEAQNHEHELIIAVSQLFGTGSKWQRAARFTVQTVLLPDTRARLRRTRRDAEALLRDRPPIPTLD